MKGTYLGYKELGDYLRQNHKSSIGSSNVCKGLLKVYDFPGNWVAWKVGCVDKVLTGNALRLVLWKSLVI